MGRGRETSIKKLVTCDWEVLPMTGHHFFMAHVTQGGAFGACCPLIVAKEGERVLKVQKGSQVFHLSRITYI